MRDLNTNTITLAPNLADIDLADTYVQLIDTANTSLSSVWTPDIMPDTELQAAMDYRNAFKQGDTITATNKFFTFLKSVYFNQPDFSLDAILFWYQRSAYTNKEITSYQSDASFYNQNILPNQIPGAARFATNAITNTNVTTNYFDVVSDSIGTIVNSKFIQLDSTLPLFDVSQQYYGVPIPIAASTDSKISATTRNVMYDLSQKTTMYMRRNLLNIGYTNTALQQNLAADATVSHGLNLINDLPTFVNINKFLGSLKDKLSTVFSQTKAFSFVQYLNTIGNTTALNLRDIFPLDPSDKDFTVITSEENAMASQAIAQQEQADAAAAAALAQQQQSIIAASNLSSSSTVTGSVQPQDSGNTTTDAATDPTTSGAGTSGVVNGKLTSDGNGFGQPDPSQLGNGVAYAAAEARNDNDGRGSSQGDRYHQNDTSGHVNGQACNADIDQYVVVSPEVARANGIKMGDWAKVTNPGTGAVTYARVMDVGPRNAPPGECSTATLKALGVGITRGGNTVGNPKVQVSYYPGSKNIAGSAGGGGGAMVASSGSPRKPGAA
jgi:hypothetical protein